VSSISWSMCSCCGSKFGFMLESALVDDGAPPEMCATCRVRGGLCLHNAYERADGLEPGEHLRFHSSRPHTGMQEFADRPEDCPVCQAARESAAWYRANRPKEWVK
jgi:hypothetical protein